MLHGAGSGGNSGNFNIDHVGYSTAGDAAMSAGDQNSNGYNTDQNWGAGATGEINPGGGATQVVSMGTFLTTLIVTGEIHLKLLHLPLVICLSKNLDFMQLDRTSVIHM